MFKEREYKAARDGLSSAGGLFLWVLVWGVNGWFTVAYLQSIAAIPVPEGAGLHMRGLAWILGVFSSVVFCWIIHLAASLIEGNFAQEMKKSGAFTFLLVLVADTYTTVAGIGVIAAGYGADMTGVWVVGAWFLALGLAVMPEWMIIRHLRDLGVLKCHSD